MTLQDAFTALAAGESLSQEQTHHLFSELMDGAYSDASKGALLMGLAVKGASVEEITGAASAMRERAIKIQHGAQDAVDTCGTGGDGKGTFNISTAAALVTAASGVPVAKHGNRSVSSRSGSADVLAELGVSLRLTPAQCGECLDEIGISFLFAPKLHPAMAEVMAVRRELGIRTVFNVLGPLTNPAGAKRQLLGVFSSRWVRPLADVLRQLGSERAWIVHGSDGLDEITVTGPTRVAQLDGGRVEEFELAPEDLGVPRYASELLVGGDAKHNAELLRGVLAAEPGALFDVTRLNAAAAIFLGGGADSVEEGLRRATAAMTQGDAARKLDELVSFGRRFDTTAMKDDSAS